MSIEIDPVALREEVAPTREHGIAPRPIVIALPVPAPDYHARMTSEQFLKLADEIAEAAATRRRMLEEFEVQAIETHPTNEIPPDKPKLGRRS